MTTDKPGNGTTASRASGNLPYPTHHVVAVLDTADAVAEAVQELTTSGFLASEVQVGCGTAAADALASSTGRKGLSGLAVRVAEAIGYENFEMRVKAVVEQALRDGHYVVLVAAPHGERKDLAIEILRKHGAHTVSYHDRLTVEAVIPPKS
jgi:hypothetical protein